MKVDKRLMLITDMTNEEAKACLKVAENIILNGVIDRDSKVVNFWIDSFSGRGGHQLLMLVTALPQRLLISYINHLEVNELIKESL